MPGRRIAAGRVGIDHAETALESAPEKAGAFYLSLLAACGLTIAGSAALIAGPWTTGLDPTSHVYPAIVWVLVIWTAAHAGSA